MDSAGKKECSGRFRGRLVAASLLNSQMWFGGWALFKPAAPLSPEDRKCAFLQEERESSTGTEDESRGGATAIHLDPVCSCVVSGGPVRRGIRSSLAAPKQGINK